LNSQNEPSSYRLHKKNIIPENCKKIDLIGLIIRNKLSDWTVGAQEIKNEASEIEKKNGAPKDASSDDQWVSA
jgi:hypothetical protein